MARGIGGICKVVRSQNVQPRDPYVRDPFPGQGKLSTSNVKPPATSDSPAEQNFINLLGGLDHGFRAFLQGAESRF